MFIPKHIHTQKSPLNCSLARASLLPNWKLIASSSFFLNCSKKHLLPLAGNKTLCAVTIDQNEMIVNNMEKRISW